MGPMAKNPWRESLHLSGIGITRVSSETQGRGRNRYQEARIYLQTPRRKFEGAHPNRGSGTDTERCEAQVNIGSSGSNGCPLGWCRSIYVRVEGSGEISPRGTLAG